MEVPTHLRHRPIVGVDFYDRLDAQFENNTDARALSIGVAQYNSGDRNDEELSLKVWRHTDEQWSRQSEELPIHRCIDLNILFLDALLRNFENEIQNNRLRISIQDADRVEDIARYYQRNEVHLRHRLVELREKLTEFLESNE
jgi:hypothetical protein